ncbi:F0F1 ATP synthase subunit B family protein [Planctomicrobium sp. SH664]|uniref:F0F1 ATP synthase subunit B family protein n=1 Tax=Planctomicrobium sp. SH664 TaxID=3448125 RepID=UPI003F5B7ECB
MFQSIRLWLTCLTGMALISIGAMDAVAAPEQHAAPHEASSADAHADAAEAGHHDAYSLKSDLPLWSAIAFVLFLAAIKKLGLWDHMVSSMADRERAETEAIQLAQDDLDTAHSLLQEARGRMESLDETVREILAEADRDAKYTRDEIIGLAQKEAQASVERVRHEINRVSNQTLNELFETLADKVTSATEARLRAGLQASDQARLVDKTLGEMAIR